MTFRTLILVLFCFACFFGLGGCRKPVPQPDYAHPLPPGARALRKVLPERWPRLDLVGDGELRSACRLSLEWFEKPSTTHFFPIDGITHDQARASVYAFVQLIYGGGDIAGRALRDEFDLYESVGWDNRGTVLFTGYYAPVFPGSQTRTSEFRYPLYRRPGNLVSDPTGRVLGWTQADGTLQTPPRRAQIELSNLLAGQELIWLRSRLDAYLVHVNGSARLMMQDGSSMYIGYAGTNGLEYTSIGQLLLKEGKIERGRLSLPRLRAYFRLHPGQLDDYLRRNDRFTFFQKYDGENWPAGSLGLPVTSMRSLATDKNVFPRGGVVWVQTCVPTPDGRSRPWQRWMLDQDTGGAIRAAGRADIYMGSGSAAELLAGHQSAEGHLYYLFLKPNRVAYWNAKSRQSRVGSRDTPGRDPSTLVMGANYTDH